MDLIFIMAGFVLFYVCYRINRKRSENKCRCPKCGTICNASGWSTGLIDGRTGYHLLSYKCKKCGYKFLR